MRSKQLKYYICMLYNTMNITDFCDKYSIKYYGISLKIGKNNKGKTTKVPQYHKLTGQPDQNDFRNLSYEELERRKQNTHLFDYIVMDTTDFIHILSLIHI